MSYYLNKKIDNKLEHVLKSNTKPANKMLNIIDNYNENNKNLLNLNFEDNYFYKSYRRDKDYKTYINKLTKENSTILGLKQNRYQNEGKSIISGFKRQSFYLNKDKANIVPSSFIEDVIDKLKINYSITKKNNDIYNRYFNIPTLIYYTEKSYVKYNTNIPLICFSLNNDEFVLNSKQNLNITKCNNLNNSLENPEHLIKDNNKSDVNNTCKKPQLINKSYIEKNENNELQSNLNNYFLFSNNYTYENQSNLEKNLYINHTLRRDGFVKLKKNCNILLNQNIHLKFRINFISMNNFSYNIIVDFLNINNYKNKEFISSDIRIYSNTNNNNQNYSRYNNYLNIIMYIEVDYNSSVNDIYNLINQKFKELNILDTKINNANEFGFVIVIDNNYMLFPSNDLISNYNTIYEDYNYITYIIKDKSNLSNIETLNNQSNESTLISINKLLHKFNNY